MKKNRCIMIFPKFENEQIIQTLRADYDPLYTYVSPHLTIVFPFESEISSESLKAHLQLMMIELKPFQLAMKGVEPSAGGYLFLNVIEGEEQVRLLHERLYTGILKEFKSTMFTYQPHLTVGRILDTELFAAACVKCKGVNDEFRTIVSRISVEIIDKNDDSMIEMEIELKRFEEA